MSRAWWIVWVLGWGIACGSSGSGDLGVRDSGPGDVPEVGTPDPGVSDEGTGEVVVGRDLPEDSGEIPGDPGGTLDEGLTDPNPEVALDPGADPVPADPGSGDLGPGGPDVPPDVPLPPESLPFAFTRPAEGDPLSPEEVTDFTRAVAAAWKQTGYFRWVIRTSMGVDRSTGKDDFLAWYNDIIAVKEGDRVTFREMGSEHNMWIPGSMMLNTVVGGALWTGDPTLLRLAEQYCKGLEAVIKGFVWDENDPAPWLMARSVFPFDHEFVLDGEFWGDDGRRKAVAFGNDTRQVEVGWNAQTFPWPHNPTWGAMWVTNMRSKDDVRAISRATTFLFYAARDLPEGPAREACAHTLDTMVHFHRDIVDEDYFIRTKDREGNAWRIPCEQQDLGSYSCYVDVDPTNECCARMAADMIAYGERRTNECGTCTGSIYDLFASTAHYYNYPIIWDYHMAGVGTALVRGQWQDAWMALKGLADRIDSYMHPSPEEPGASHPDWWQDMAVLLVQAASVGLPLTAAEARHVQQYWRKSVEEFTAWPYWDLWAQPDGTYSGATLRPRASPEGIPIEAWGVLLEYCASPLKNPAGAAFVDCEVLRDPASW
ncbi:MAG TPA: hypothetical protein PLQ97_03375 [Myxococcota bacterium]|nr:hypothetical protein [Myxococcota bacterium]HQK50104.1 hypothetical protein [Myxococcota bacterium]